ncbi:MAG: OprD family outer membrane porin [Methylococcales bacterium]|nr:OprD family outer membrane porin [Methylococcales bacterium]
MIPRYKFFLIVISCSLFSSNYVRAAQQPEYILDEQLAPESALEIKGSLAKAFEKFKRRKSFFPGIKSKLENLPPFWRDTHFSANFRSYYFDRNRKQSHDSQAWTYGGSLKYKSGWWQNFLQVGASVYTSQKIIAPEDKDGTLLLKPGQHGFAVLGEAYLAAQFTQNLEAKVFRQALDLPYLNKHDNRMVPNTFEAYMLTHTSNSLEWILGYVRKMKKRNSNDFEYMSQAAGFNKTHKGQALLGARYSLTNNTDIGFLNYFTEDYMNTFYTEANHVFFPEDQIPIQLSLQYTNQQSSGSEIGGDFNTYSFGGKMSLSYQSLVLTAAATSTGKNKGIQKPFGGTPSYLSIMVEDFDRAGENAWLIGLSYHFKKLGLDGVTAFSSYAYGNTPDSGSSKSPDQSEWDITVDYKPQQSLLNGLWLRLRRASVNRKNPGEDLIDYRIILNYEVQFL